MESQWFGDQKFIPEKLGWKMQSAAMEHGPAYRGTWSASIKSTKTFKSAINYMNMCDGLAA